MHEISRLEALIWIYLEFEKISEMWHLSRVRAREFKTIKIRTHGNILSEQGFFIIKTGIVRITLVIVTV
jgi:hypothetical protein